jgi:non-specific serine/threonine protein kinase/serine/threonine-protein kinase
MEAADWARVKSLFQEALARERVERSAFLEKECGGDRDLLRRVARLLDADAGSDGFMETPVANLPYVTDLDEGDEGADAAAPERIGPYRVERVLGRGGMGTVYLASRDDGDFRRPVAVKVVRRSMDSAFVFRRFETERRILAALDHPGIARLYDGGTTEDGVPYFVMEYVPGEGLLAYCDERRLGVAQRLALFRRVCGAVQFAHQALVVHRDLKPSNVLVTPEGHPKLLDFGIAKLLDPEATADVEDGTATLWGVMTPDYASPEQLRRGRVTTASDVYSLGVILYELLSGHRPYRLAAGADEGIFALARPEVMPPSAAVTRTEEIPCRGTESVVVDPETVGAARSTPAGRLRRVLRGDLDNIVMKAMRTDPATRYATAAELAEDVGRYLEGQPVLAQGDRAAYRAAKFVRRHRLGVAATAAGVVALAAGLAVALWQARVARAERELAQRRFGEARRLIHFVVFDLQPRLGRVAGATSLRKTMVDETLVYLETLARDAGDSPDLLRELSASYRQLAQLQGDLNTANVGEMTTALETLAKAEALVTRLLALDPRDTESLGEASAVYRQLSYLSHNAKLAAPSQADQAEAYTRRAVELAERRMAIAPRDASARRDLADGLFALASRTRSPEVYDRCRTLYEDLLRENPGDPRLSRNVALVHKNVASLHYGRGDYGAGLDAALKAREIDARLLAAEPQNPQAQMDLAIDHYQVSTALGFLGDRAGSLESLEQSVALREQILARNPDDARAKDRLAFALAALAGRRDGVGDGPRARLDYERALRLYADLHGQGTRHVQALSGLARVRLGLARMEADRGGRETACAHYRESAALFGELTEADGLEPADREGREEARRGAAACGSAAGPLG